VLKSKKEQNRTGTECPKRYKTEPVPNVPKEENR